MKHIPSFEEFLNESSSNIKNGDVYSINKNEGLDIHWSDSPARCRLHQTMETFGEAKVDSVKPDSGEHLGKFKVPGKITVFGNEITIIKAGSRNSKVEIKGALSAGVKDKYFKSDDVCKGTIVCTVENWYIDQFLKSKYLV